MEQARTPRGHLVLLGLTALVTFAVLPIAGRPVGTHPSFLPGFFATVLLLDLLSAWLLAMQYRSHGRPRTLVFALAYVWCVLSVVPHVLTFPGLVAPTGLLGATPSTATWLWTSWHAGFAVLLCVGALPLAVWDRVRASAVRDRDVALAAGALLVVAAGTATLATAGNALLPPIIAADDYSRLTVTVGPWVIAVNALALVLTARLALRSDGLERWFVAVAGASLGDVLLSLLAEARYTAGWYGGRAMSAAAAGTVLLALVGQVTRLYRDLELRSAQLRQLAHTDDLTGLANRRQVLATGQALAETGVGIAVAVVDLDHFKDVNDTLGHDAGDQVLFAAAGRMDRALRATDHLGRYGGEEFLVLLPDTSLTDAVVVLERLRAAVGDRPVVTSHGAVTPTVSVGVALLAPGGLLTDAVADADRALYDAKARGRNQVATDGAVTVPAQLERRGSVPTG